MSDKKVVRRYTLWMESGKTDGKKHKVGTYTLLEIDQFTTGFADKEQLFNTLNNTENLQMDSHNIRVYITYNYTPRAKNKDIKPTSTIRYINEIFYALDREVIYRHKIKETVMERCSNDKNFLNDFCGQYLNTNLKGSATSIIDSGYRNTSKRDDPYNIFFAQLFSVEKNSDKAFRDAYSFMKRYDLAKLRRFERKIEDTNSISALQSIRQELETSKKISQPKVKEINRPSQMTIFDMDAEKKGE
jgi:hypothetical protein